MVATSKFDISQHRFPLKPSRLAHSLLSKCHCCVVSYLWKGPVTLRKTEVTLHFETMLKTDWTQNVFVCEHTFLVRKHCCVKEKHCISKQIPGWPSGQRAREFAKLESPSETASSVFLERKGIPPPPPHWDSIIGMFLERKCRLFLRLLSISLLFTTRKPAQPWRVSPFFVYDSVKEVTYGFQRAKVTMRRDFVGTELF